MVFANGTRRANAVRVECEELTHATIGASMEVHRSLGPGFLESIYKNALLHELQLHHLSTKVEIEIHVAYKDVIVGKHRLDMIIENQVVVELKAVGGMRLILISSPDDGFRMFA